MAKCDPPPETVTTGIPGWKVHTGARMKRRYQWALATGKVKPKPSLKRVLIGNAFLSPDKT